MPKIFNPVQSNNSVNSYMKGSDIVNITLKKIKDLFGGDVDIEEEDLLRYLNDVVYEFSKSSRDATGWRWSKKEYKIALQPAIEIYELPNHLQSVISVTVLKDSLFNNTSKRMKVHRVDSLNEDKIYYNSYSVIGNKITISNIEAKKGMRVCGGCGQCGSCHLISGTVIVKYFSEFKEVCSLDSNLDFLPNETSIKKYLIEKLTEEILTVRLSQPYTSPKTAMYYRDVVQYDEKLFTPQIQTNKSSLLNFNKIMKY